MLLNNVLKKPIKILNLTRTNCLDDLVNEFDGWLYSSSKFLLDSNDGIKYADLALSKPMFDKVDSSQSSKKSSRL